MRLSWPGFGRCESAPVRGSWHWGPAYRVRTALVALALGLFWQGCGRANPASAIPPSPEMTHVRFLHAAPGAPALDLRFDGTKLFGGGFGNLSDYLSVPAGAHELRLSEAGTDARMLDMGRVDLPAGRNLTAIAVSQAGGKGLGLWILMDSGLAPRHGAAGIRLAHASPDAAHASVSVDGKVLVAGIPSRQVSQYAAIGTGGHAVKLLFLGAQAPVLDVGELDFQAGANYTLFLVGVRAATPPMAAFVARDRVS